jgi:hypothetical protein
MSSLPRKWQPCPSTLRAIVATDLHHLVLQRNYRMVPVIIVNKDH